MSTMSRHYEGQLTILKLLFPFAFELCLAS